MSEFDCKEMKQMWRRWIDANECAEAANDWPILGSSWFQYGGNYEWTE